MRISLGMVTLAVLLQATSCATTYQESVERTTDVTEQNNDSSVVTDNLGEFGKGYFTVIRSWGDVSYSYWIMYANDTRVKYFAFRSSRSGGILPLYNTDGTLQVQDTSPPAVEE